MKLSYCPKIAHIATGGFPLEQRLIERFRHFHVSGHQIAPDKSTIAHCSLLLAVVETEHELKVSITIEQMFAYRQEGNVSPPIRLAVCSSSRADVENEKHRYQEHSDQSHHQRVIPTPSLKQTRRQSAAPARASATNIARSTTDSGESSQSIEIGHQRRPHRRDRPKPKPEQNHESPDRPGPGRQQKEQTDGLASEKSDQHYVGG